MAQTLSETEACDLLARLFTARGYRIVRNVLFREYGVEFHADGWDAKARVGFEFLSSEDEDHIDLSLEEYQTLSDAQRRGELALFIIDEVEPLSAADLVAEAADFLDEAEAGARAARAARAGRRAAPRRKPRASARIGTRKSGAAVTSSAAKRAAQKKAATKAAATKAVAKKPVGTKTKAGVKARKPAAAAAKKAGATRKPAVKPTGRRTAAGAAS